MVQNFFRLLTLEMGLIVKLKVGRMVEVNLVTLMAMVGLLVGIRRLILMVMRAGLMVEVILLGEAWFLALFYLLLSF